MWGFMQHFNSIKKNLVGESLSKISLCHPKWVVRLLCNYNIMQAKVACTSGLKCSYSLHL